MNMWFTAYRTRNVTFEARLFWFMAYRTRNVTFEAPMFWFIAYRTINMLHLKRDSCGLRPIERRTLLLKRTCFGLWLIER